jgi:hypothetical protein
LEGWLSWFKLVELLIVSFNGWDGAKK